MLASNIKKPSYMALEIGASNGIENCTSFLCIAKKYQTLMIEGDPKLAKRAKLILDYLQGSHEIVNLLVTPENINILEKYSI